MHLSDGIAALSFACGKETSFFFWECIRGKITREFGGKIDRNSAVVAIRKDDCVSKRSRKIRFQFPKYTIGLTLFIHLHHSVASKNEMMGNSNLIQACMLLTKCNPSERDRVTRALRRLNQAAVVQAYPALCARGTSRGI
ncbi:hypothetical protein TSAR_003755 [Trichomalopsis sarcophagae]|uniref:Uncharacterized protein n=1 Tax=Trichomalopsis sarcophagae TaxID=543379 RepID=A0A232FJ54_9HYME|nr:hypothetical protein TSAR_003755 [Trichomalopsis sarcophagae]